MDLSTPLFLIPFYCGILYVAAGFLLWRFPPKNINSLYGYRTKSSMKNQARWDFSQQFSANEMIKWGVVMLLSSILGLVTHLSESLGTILGIGLLILATITLLIRTERAIKERFGEDG
jgi:uncharacterized membrane protein